MTATLPTCGPSTTGGPPRIRLDARPGAVYAYRVLGLDGFGYVGQARSPERRDRQHRGLAPQRDGVVREQPWADLIIGGMVILERGVWTDAELDAAELRHMHTLLPRLNMRDSVTPDRIPIYVQRQERDARDIAHGLPARDWAGPHGPGVVPLQRRVVVDPVTPVVPSLWSRFWATRLGRWLAERLYAAKRAAVLRLRRAGRWVVPRLALSVAACLALIVAAAYQDYPLPWNHAAVGGVGLVGGAEVGWRKLTRPKRRSGPQQRGRTNRRRVR